MQSEIELIQKKVCLIDWLPFILDFWMWSDHLPDDVPADPWAVPHRHTRPGVCDGDAGWVLRHGSVAHRHGYTGDSGEKMCFLDMYYIFS